MNILQTTSYFGANYLHLRHLFILRNLFILVQVSAIFIAVFFMRMDLPLTPIVFEIACLISFNIFVWLRLSRYDDVSDNEIFRHLLFDIAALTVVLYFTGGATNPFITLYIFPLIISITVFSSRFAWVFVAITLLCYSFLIFQSEPIEMIHSVNKMDGEFNTHIIGMWMAFAFSAGLVAHFVVKMGSTIRSQDKLLVKAKEDALRDRQIIELGTLAASTAHELGTPLATMNLLVTEIENELYEIPQQVTKDLNTLSQQIERCKNALSNLSISAGAMNVNNGSASAVSDYLTSVLSEWKLVRPDILIDPFWRGVSDEALILDDRTLTQALMNILNNAADVSPEDVEWDATWTKKEIIMEIRDRGCGLTEESKQQLGKIQASKKDQGLGLGLFLSHAIIQRFGGSVSLTNREGGGMTTRISIPLLDNIPGKN